MVHRVILQMDQTAPKDQILLRKIRKCCKNPDMNSYLSICTCSDCEKETKNRTIDLRNSTGFEYKHIL